MCREELQALFPTPSSVGVLPFARVCSLLGAHGTAAEHDVLEELQRVCVLVQGCWVVRSEVLYPKDYASPHHGVGSDVMCRARDLTVGDFIWVGLSCHCMGQVSCLCMGRVSCRCMGRFLCRCMGRFSCRCMGRGLCHCIVIVSSGPSSCTSPLLRW